MGGVVRVGGMVGGGEGQEEKLCDITRSNSSSQ